MQTKTLLIAIAALLLIVGVFYFYSASDEPTPRETPTPPPTEAPTTPPPSEVSTSTETAAERGPTTIIGSSANDHDITAYHFGNGERELLFVGGIHGGYSWNTALVAYELIDHLTANPNLVPENLTVTVIPFLNPDGLAATVGTTGRFTSAQVPQSETQRIAGRFNSNTVDINRNFDCEWNATGTWQAREVSGGSAPFSEPESQAIRDYVASSRPVAALAWYSAAGGVYASNCGRGVPAATTALLNTYAQASGYPAYNEFDYYEITGDMVNWFAKENIPAISVLLTDHNNTEWAKNRAGIEAMISAYATE